MEKILPLENPILKVVWGGNLMHMPSASSSAQVLIAGAGPTGLVLAIWLRKRGISVRIIDKSAAPGTTSRALAVQARTLEFYRQLGIADDLIRLGILVPQMRMRRAGRVVATARFDAIGEGMSHFAYLLFCPQDVHEQLLCKVLESLGTKVERSTELLNFSQDSTRVRATLKTSYGEQIVESKYLCGCDGAHSAVRNGLGIGFPGGTYSQVFFVADVESQSEAQGLQISVSRKDFCIVMPVHTQGTVRLTGVVPPESETKSAITFSDVADSVNHNTGIKVDKVNWFSTYHVHHRVADFFQKDRVFLAGDAGHIHSPAGGQGMNTGIGDAVNLAWKLAGILQGRHSIEVLKSYEPERIAFARTLVKTTDTVFKLIASRSVVGSLFRAYLLPGFFARLTQYRSFLQFTFRTISQIRIQYRKSAISEGSLGDVHAGDRLPWVKFGFTDNFAPLTSLDWQIHIYGEAKESFRISMEELGIPIHTFEFNDHAQAQGLQKGAVYGVRPDGYVGLILSDQDPVAVKKYAEHLALSLT